MSFLPASRTKRNLFKIASLGLAGLLAGLFAGCNDFSDPTISVSCSHLSTDSLAADASSTTQRSSLPKSIEETQIPALRHPPTSRSLQYGSVRTASITRVSTGHNRS